MFSQIVFTNGLVLLAFFSAAKWISPYARTGSEYFYATEAGLAFLKEQLKLASTIKGENVVGTLLEDQDFPITVEHQALDISCTDPVRTYLDLWVRGERGRGAAEHLRNKKLVWKR